MPRKMKPVTLPVMSWDATPERLAKAANDNLKFDDAVVATMRRFRNLADCAGVLDNARPGDPIFADRDPDPEVRAIQAQGLQRAGYGNDASSNAGAADATWLAGCCGDLDPAGEAVPHAEHRIRESHSDAELKAARSALVVEGRLHVGGRSVFERWGEARTHSGDVEVLQASAGDEDDEMGQDSNLAAPDVLGEDSDDYDHRQADAEMGPDERFSSVDRTLSPVRTERIERARLWVGGGEEQLPINGALGRRAAARALLVALGVDGASTRLPLEPTYGPTGKQPACGYNVFGRNKHRAGVKLKAPSKSRIRVITDVSEYRFPGVAANDNHTVQAAAQRAFSDLERSAPKGTLDAALTICRARNRAEVAAKMRPSSGRRAANDIGTRAINQTAEALGEAFAKLDAA